MTTSNKLQTIGIFLLSISIVFAGLFIGLSLRTKNETNSVVNIEQASEYLGISTEVITDIIIWEDAHPENFNAEIMKLPYYIIGKEKYFTPGGLEAWVHNVSVRSVFNRFVLVNEGWITK